MGPVGNISGCAFWYSADSMSLSNGTLVTAINDLSGSGNNLGPTTSSTAFFPTFFTNKLNGLPVFGFSGTNSLRGPNIASASFSNSGLTVFSVYSTTGNYQQILLADDAGVFQTGINFLIGLSSTYFFEYSDPSNPHTFTMTSGIPANQYILRHDRFDQNGNFYFGYFGIDVASGNFKLTNTNSSITLGTSRAAFFNNYFQGNVAEIVGYNKALSNTDFKSVNQYLYNKYFTSSSTFSPSNVTGLVLWLDPANIGLSSTNRPVTYWSDKSVQQNDFTFSFGGSSTINFPTYRSNVINGYPVVSFSGINALTCIGANPLRLDNHNLSCFIAYSTNSNVAQTILSNDGGSLNTTDFLIGTSSTFYFAYNPGASDRAFFMNSGTPINQFVVRADRFSNNSTFLFEFDGIPIQSSTLPSLNYTSPNLQLGQSPVPNFNNYFQGDIAEIIVYDNSVSESDAHNVNQYLINKYLGGSGSPIPPQPPFVQPPDYSGLFGWYRSTSIGITGVDGSKVIYWPDDSGSGNHVSIDLINSGIWNSPKFYRNQFNGYPSIRFNNGDFNGYLISNFNQSLNFGYNDLTTFCVFKTNDPIDAQSIFSFNAQDGNMDAGIVLNYNLSNAFSFIFNFPSSGFVVTNAHSPTMGTHVYNPNTTVIRHDRFRQGDNAFCFGLYGADIASGYARTNWDLPRNVVLGGTWKYGLQFLGDLAEIICYNRELTDFETQNVNDYLLLKYSPSNVNNVPLFINSTSNSGMYKNTKLFVGGANSSIYNNINLFTLNTPYSGGTTLYVQSATHKFPPISLFLENNLNYNSGISLYLDSHMFNENDITLYTSGTIAKSNYYFPLFMDAAGINNSSIPIYMSGANFNNHSTTLFTQASTQQFPHITLYMNTIGSGNGVSMPLYIDGNTYPSMTGNKTLFLANYYSSPNNNSLYNHTNLFLKGGFDSHVLPFFISTDLNNTNPSSTLPLFITTQINTGSINNNFSIYLSNNVNNINSDVKRLYINGLGGLDGGSISESQLLPLYLQQTGVAPIDTLINHNLSLYTTSAYFENDNLPLFVNSANIAMSSVNLFINANNNTAQGINAYVEGRNMGLTENITMYTRGF